MELFGMNSISVIFILFFFARLIGFKIRSSNTIKRYILKIGYSRGDFENYKASNKNRFEKHSHTNS